MKTTVLGLLVAMLVIAACTQTAKTPTTAPSAQPTAGADVAKDIESVDTLNDDVQNEELDSIDQDLTLVDQLG